MPLHPNDQDKLEKMCQSYGFRNIIEGLLSIARARAARYGEKQAVYYRYFAPKIALLSECANEIARIDHETRELEPEI